MHTSIFALLAVGAGACIALQASANASLRKNIGDNALVAAYLSILGTLIVSTVAVLLLRPPVPATADLRDAPWWNWIGGPLGALIVLAGAALTARLGAAFFIALVVGGQLVCSLLLDHFALMGLSEQPVTAGKLLGAALVVTGVVCIKFL
jgi:bacterial/archaeal transporter family-2 protein